jgi:hypothetical protein
LIEIVVAGAANLTIDVVKWNHSVMKTNGF